MKKNILALIFVLWFVSFNGKAQWTLSGINLKNDNTGNVGVNLGTKTPYFPLAVGDSIGLVQKSSTNPYFVIRGLAASGYVQSIGAEATYWSRFSIAQNLHWNNTANNWQVDGGLYSDFSALNFENNGDMAFYANGSAGTSYSMTHSSLQSFKRLVIRNEGTVYVPVRLSIGTAFPIAQFQVGDGISSFSVGNANSSVLNYGTTYFGFNAARNGAGNWVLRADGANNGAGVIYGDVAGNIYFAPIATTGAIQRELTAQQLKDKIAVKITNEGVLRAKQIKVETSGWPDFVFDPSYQLRSLNELSKYIQEHKHLPETPSAAEIEKDGINVAEMNTLLMKKVEELTMYLIQKDAEIQNERQYNAQQQKQLNELSKKINALMRKSKE
ncbi:hypothetical protein [Pedobacter sp. MW01-1-1]|uniref:hypothetical protein n=1 Tax=Pedobacter sp. MW01-1-1 TaxID=3383027 RepID=UPI003FEFFA84